MLFKHEFYKLFHSKTFYITVGIAFAVALFGDIYSAISERGQEPIEYHDNGWTSYDNHKYNLTNGLNGLIETCFNVQFWALLVSVIIASIIVIDYSNGTIRNTVMAGHKRTHIYFTKLIVCVIVTLLIVLMFYSVSTIVYSVSAGFGKINFGRYAVTFVLLFFLATALACVIVFFTDLTRNIGAAICIPFGLIIVFMLIGGNGSEQSTFAFNRVSYFIGELYVGNNLLNISYTLKAGVIVKYFVTAIATIIITSGVGCYLFTKRGLK